ncbi:MAG: hypothetical protein WDM96_02880 [Lacunisphaera sp.]
MELPEGGESLGHGMCISDPGHATGRTRVIAFVDGFDWLRRGTAPVVHFDPRYFPADPAGDSLRAALEAVMRARPHVWPREIAPGFPLQLNG